jgi:TRAP-type C4-dicarboxylate transport system permease small subunit
MLVKGDSKMSVQSGPGKSPGHFKWLQQVSDVLNKGTVYALIAIMIVMTVTICLQVFYRYVLNNSLSWTEEVARYLMIWSCFLGSAMAVKYGEHIGVSFLRDLFPKRLQVVNGFFINLVVIIFFGIAFWKGMSITIMGIPEQAPATSISMAWAYSSIPVSFLIMIIHALATMFYDPGRSEVIATVS